MEETIMQLASSQLFSGLDRSVVELVAPSAVRLRVAKGAYLFRSGEPRTSLFLVVNGKLDVRVTRGDGAGMAVLLGPGEVVAEAALLEPSVHSADGCASCDLEVVELPADRVRECLALDVEAAMSVLASVARIMTRRLQYSSARRAGWDGVLRPGLTRTEHDLLGEREVPEDARYGIQTLRAVENFPITGIRLAHFPRLVVALAMVKQAAVRANRVLGLLDEGVAGAIDSACQEIIEGHHHGHFVVDVIQGGAGTSTNMNANEVIANCALEILGHRRGDYRFCHPNNHVNLSQSTNDVYPSCCSRWTRPWSPSCSTFSPRCDASKGRSPPRRLSSRRCSRWVEPSSRTRCP